MQRNALICFFLLLGLTMQSQTRRRNFRQRELGFFGGASYYIGDINTRQHFLGNHPAGGIFFRYTTNYRYAWRFGFNYGNISGSDAASGNPDQIERNISFRSPIYELSAIAEFNFFDYRIGNDKHNFTLFVFGGFAGNYTKPVSDIGYGYAEGQREQVEADHKPYKHYQLVMPFGVGLKFHIGDKAGLSFEWGPRKTFTDKLDDVSGAYGSSSLNNPPGSEGQPSFARSPGSMRGNPVTKDWYFFYGVSISFKLKESRRPCHAYQ